MQDKVPRARQCLALHGYEVTTFDLASGWNFEKAHHRREFFKLFRNVCPDFVWLAPPCTVWSPIPSLTPRSNEQLHAFNVKETIKNMSTSSSLVVCFRSEIEMPLLNGPIEHCLGRHLPLKRCWSVDILPDWINVHMELCCLTNKAHSRLFENRPLLAQELSWTCPGGHRHLPIEGSSPGIGNRAKASATYQPLMCKYLATSIDNFINNKQLETTYVTSDRPASARRPPSLSLQPDIPQPQDQLQSTPDTPQDSEQTPPTYRGILHRLQPSTNLEAQRTIQRLHRNLGHPTTAQLEKPLKERNANERLLEANRAFKCEHCTGAKEFYLQGHLLQLSS